MNRAIFLDRDGILNEVIFRDKVVASPRTREEFRLLAGARELVAAVKSRGFLAIVVTNQPDIARGLMRPEELATMHADLGADLPIDAIFVADSGDDADPRRKPNPGMLVEAAERKLLDLGHSWILGDSVKDIEAGRRAGVQTMLLETHYNTNIHGTADKNFCSLAEATHFINTL